MVMVHIHVSNLHLNLERKETKHATKDEEKEAVTRRCCGPLLNRMCILEKDNKKLYVFRSEERRVGKEC